MLIMVCCFMCLMSYPVLRSEMFSGTHAEKYEDTKTFADQVLHTGQGISSALGRREVFETDGAYDPEKIINVGNYNQGESHRCRKSGKSFLPAGRFWSTWGKTAGSGSEEQDSYEDNIVVCRRADGTYHYYYYSEFQELIQNGDLSFVMASDERRHDAGGHPFISQGTYIFNGRDRDL